MEPLSALSPSKQNTRANDTFPSSPGKVSVMMTAPMSPPDSPNHNDTQADFHDAPSSPQRTSVHSSAATSPSKTRSPVKYRLQDDGFMASSPAGSPAESTVRFNEGLTRAVADMQNGGQTGQILTPDEGMSTIYHSPNKLELGDDTELTLSMDRTHGDDTVGDLSTISAIQTDMTRFAGLRDSPTKTARSDAWSPSKQLRSSAGFSTPGQPRPLLLGRRSSSLTGSIEEEEEATPRQPKQETSPVDLMNFTGSTNIHIPPPEPAPRSTRRSPSGRGGFPIKVNPAPTPVHRSQASMDREKAGGRSVQRTVPSTPANHRHSMYGAPTGFGMDLLDIDLEPMATPRSIPSVTPRELETLRSELQSRISGLEATLSGKEAEVMALKRAITDAEVRAGKACEDLRTEQNEKEQLEHQNVDLARRTREMEEVLRELKQNAFVEEREREKLRKQVEEADRRAEESEVKILELNATLETLRSDRIMGSPSPQKSIEPTTPGQGHIDVDAAVKNATETVARELHSLYKTKHERKVSDLKVSYEKRWMKQVESLRNELKEAHDEILRLQTEREATMSGVLPTQLQHQSDQIAKMDGQIEELRRFNEETVTEKKMIEAELSGLKSTLESVRRENSALRKEVEMERVEKGELVAQVEVFLTVSGEQERELERLRQQEAELRQQREVQRTQPVSPPRSDSDASSATSVSGYIPGHRPASSVSMVSPNKHRNSINGVQSLYATNNGPTGMNASGRPRPMSMLQKPAGGKFSGIPAPGLSGLKAPTKVSTPGNSRGGLMEGIARMGAGGR